MSKYIEVEIAKAIIFNCDMSMNDYEVALTRIDKNCEDIEPVRHGEWIGKPVAGYSTVKCSYCGTVFTENSGKWNYCPNCGAKMDI